MWMALTGHCITAEQALNCGLITRIVPEEELEDEVNKLAESIAKVPPAVHNFTKRAINVYYEGLGIKQFEEVAMAYVHMTEVCNVPGHYHDFFDLVREVGFTEGYKRQRAKWSYPDRVMEMEVQRLKAKKGK